jgi:hypothetical protein
MGFNSGLKGLRKKQQETLQSTWKEIGDREKETQKGERP